TPLNRAVWQAWYEQTVAAERLTYEEWSDRKIRAMVPLGRWQTPESIADMIVFLSSERAAYVTGQTINVDGGFLLHWEMGRAIYRLRRAARGGRRLALAQTSPRRCATFATPGAEWRWHGTVRGIAGSDQSAPSSAPTSWIPSSSLSRSTAPAVTGTDRC